MSFFFSRAISLSALSLTLSAPCAVAAVVVDAPPSAALPDTGHAAPVRALVYAPDGQTVWSVDGAGELLVRSRDGKSTLFREQLNDNINGLRVLSDGSFLAGQSFGAVVHYAKPNGKPLQIERSLSGPEVGLQALANPGPFYQLELGNWVLSPDEKKLAIVTLETARSEKSSSTPGQRSARVRIWDLNADAAPIEVTVIDEVKPARGIRPTFSPLLAWQNAQTLVVASEVSTRSFDAQSGAQTGEWRPSADAATPADPAADEAEELRRIEKLPPALQERALRAIERRKNAPVNPNAAPDFGTLEGLSPDATWLLAATRAGFRLWNLRDNAVRTLEGSARAGADEIAWSPDGNWVAARNGRSVRSWNVNGDKSLSYLGAPDFTDIAWSPDSAQLAAANAAAQVQIWPANVPAMKTMAQPTLVLPGYFNGWNFIRSAGDRLLAATNDGVAVIEKNGKPRWLENLPIEAPAALPNNATFDVKAIALAPDGKSWVETVSIGSYTATMENDGIPRSEVRARDVANGQILWRKSDFNIRGAVETLAFAPDGTLLTGKEGGGISARPMDESLTGLSAFNGKTGEAVDLGIEWGVGGNGTGYPGSVSSIAVAPNGETAVFADRNDSRIVDLKTRQRIGYISMNAQRWNGNAAISPDGNFLAGQIYNSFGLYDLRNPDKTYGNKMTVKLDMGESARATAVAYANDGKLALALRDGRVMVWSPNPTNGAKSAWETPKGRVANALNWSADGQTLRIGNARGELQWRDGNSGQLQKTLRLTPPTNGSAPNWVSWNAAGAIEKSG